MLLWKHEFSRVFSDRFTHDKDKDWFNKAMYDITEEVLGTEYKKNDAGQGACLCGFYEVSKLKLDYYLTAAKPKTVVICLTCMYVHFYIRSLLLNGF